MTRFNSVLTHRPTLIPTTERQLALDATNNSSYNGTGSTWTDLEGNANGTISGATFSSGDDEPTNNPSYFSFDGTNDSVELPDTAGVNDFTISNNYTVEAWVWPSSTQNTTESGDNDIIEKWNGSLAVGYPFVLRFLRATNTVSFAVYNGSAGTSTSVSVNTDQWNHVVGSFDHTTNDLLTVVGNGYNVSTTALTLTGTIDNDNPMWVARRGTVNPGDKINWFTGRIAKVRIYNKALTQNEISRNFNAERRFFGV